MEKYILNPDDAYNLYKIAYEVSQLLEKNGIFYWACGGTFLGAIRCGGIIKWDDDLDFCVLMKDKQRLEEVLERDGRFVMIQKKQIVHKIFYKNGEKIKGYNYGYPFVDIFFMEPIQKDGKTIYICSLKGARNFWKNEYYLEEELNPLKKYKFGGYYINTPNNYERYFVGNFGNNWDKIGVISYDHKNEKVIDKIEWKLRERDYEPAFPFYYGDVKEKWWHY